MAKSRQAKLKTDTNLERKRRGGRGEEGEEREIFLFTGEVRYNSTI